MPDELLTRIRTEIEERLEQSRAARHEFARLQRAMAALDASYETEAEPSPAPSPTAPRRRHGRNGATPNRRAPRGQNRERVLSVVAERPGATSAEISRASGVESPVLYALLTRLVASGELEKEQLPGGGAGYAVPTPNGSTAFAAVPEAGGTAPAG